MHYLPRRSRTSPLVFQSLRSAIPRACLLVLAAHSATAIHHMKIKPPTRELSSRQSANTPLVVSNLCGETIYPGILTQSGIGPGTGGFELTPGSNKSMTVSENWQGRVWGRANCTFSGSSGSCGSGDCGGVVSCTGTGQVPTTLAEFTLDAGDGHTYYDLSLVDGYNMPIAIVMLPNANSSFQAIPQNLTNPSCVGTVGDLQAPGFNPYNTSASTFLGTNASDPLPFENTVTLAGVAQWCPFALQVSTSTSPSGGVYIYPDGSLNRPQFDPCYSACSKYNDAADCCTGAFDSPTVCVPSSYSKAAKTVCPDAYSYAFDDQTSTFIIPAGAGFEVIFCPGGRSTNIIATSKGKLVQLAQSALSSLSKLEAKQQETSDNRAAQAAAVVSSRSQDASTTEPPTPARSEMEEINAAKSSTLLYAVEVLTSTVLALAAAATSYTATEVTIINQWQDTGLFGNTTASTASRSVPPPPMELGKWAYYALLAVAGFFLWIAW